jgi:sulfite oxidase
VFWRTRLIVIPGLFDGAGGVFLTQTSSSLWYPGGHRIGGSVPGGGRAMADDALKPSAAANTSAAVTVLCDVFTTCLRMERVAWAAAAQPSGWPLGIPCRYVGGMHGKRAGTIVYSEEPFNAETARAALAEGACTATDAFYVRSHGPVPSIDADAFRLHVHGAVERELDLSLRTLKEAFVEREITATLQCAGNRRKGLMAIREIPGEAPWGPGATGTATWTGVALADVLALAAPRENAAHAGFQGADDTPEERGFGGSIPLAKACRPEVLLAYAMNGEPLAPVHGAPLRVVVPGYIGARSIKWLTRIEVRDQPWSGYFQHVAYRLLPEDEHPGPGKGLALGLVALNADILAPADGATVPQGPTTVSGYAFAGGERYVARVDVSVDDGRWRQAELGEDLGPWAWRQWQIVVDLSPGEHEIVVRAWDSSAATQPEDEAALWNPKGYVNNARPRLRLSAT